MAKQMPCNIGYGICTMHNAVRLKEKNKDYDYNSILNGMKIMGKNLMKFLT
jgi:hypothetical protein